MNTFFYFHMLLSVTISTSVKLPIYVLFEPQYVFNFFTLFSIIVIKMIKVLVLIVIKSIKFKKRVLLAIMLF